MSKSSECGAEEAKHWLFSRRIIISETFRNFPKVSETLGDWSFDYIVFTCGFASVVPIKVISVHKMTFLAENAI